MKGRYRKREERRERKKVRKTKGRKMEGTYGTLDRDLCQDVVGQWFVVPSHTIWYGAYYLIPVPDQYGIISTLLRCLV